VGWWGKKGGEGGITPRYFFNYYQNSRKEARPTADRRDGQAEIRGISLYLSSTRVRQHEVKGGGGIKQGRAVTPGGEATTKRQWGAPY